MLVRRSIGTRLGSCFWKFQLLTLSLGNTQGAVNYMLSVSQSRKLAVMA